MSASLNKSSLVNKTKENSNVHIKNFYLLLLQADRDAHFYPFTIK